MVSTYSHRSTAELLAVKDALLSGIGGACSETALRLAAHLDAIEDELGRRVSHHYLLVRAEVDINEDGEAEEVLSLHCPACDERMHNLRSYCPRCGTAVRMAA